MNMVSAFWNVYVRFELLSSHLESPGFKHRFLPVLTAPSQHSPGLAPVTFFFFLISQLLFYVYFACMYVCVACA